MILEVCTGCYNDCIKAYRAGAKRVELNSALSLGGLTPSLATLRNVKRDMDLKVMCMVRNRAAGFCYSDDEFKIMKEDAKILLENGADGIVAGFLTEKHQIDVEKTREMAALAHSCHKEFTFHRAIDVCRDYESSIEVLIALHVDRVLTSGQRKTALEGKQNLGRVQEKYGQEIHILAGVGINASNVKDIILSTHVNEVHSSCKGYEEDASTAYNDISYGYLENKNAFEVVSEEKVRELVSLILK